MAEQRDASDVQPGDLIFFQGTYDTTGASHVGIVVDPVNNLYRYGSQGTARGSRVQNREIESENPYEKVTKIVT